MSIKLQISKEAVYEKHCRKELLNMFRRTVTELSNMKLKNIVVQPEINFGKPDCFDFSITVFSHKGGNCTQTFYDFQDIDDSKARLAAFLKSIRKGFYPEINNFRWV